MNFSAEERAEIEARSTDKGWADDTFTCPGCDEPATAKDGSMCPKCGQFVHGECTKGDSDHLCPVCMSELQQ